MKSKKKNIKEMSSASGGAVTGMAGNMKKQKMDSLIDNKESILEVENEETENESEDFLFDREEIVKEIKYREIISASVRESLRFMKEENRKKRGDKRIERGIKLIFEAKKSPVPHDSTGVNILEDTLKKVIPIIHDDFISLTSNVSQRQSFRAHIVNAFKNAIAPYRATEGGMGELANYSSVVIVPPPGPEDDENFKNDSVPMDDRIMGEFESPAEVAKDMGIEDELSGEQGNQQPNKKEPETAQDKFMEVDPEKEKEQEVDPEKLEKDKFTLPKEDKTGRNLALITFKRIEKIIVDNYSLLDSKEDRDIYYEYGIINMKLYFDRWEDELQAQLEEM